MSDSKRICCKYCILFMRTEDGKRGGIKGKCRIRRPNETRNGSNTPCKFFKGKEV